MCEYGGIYIDTDVEIIKKLDDLLNQEAFGGLELRLNKTFGFNTGSMIGSISNQKFLIKQEESYHNYSFVNNDGSLNTTSCVDYSTDLLRQFGFKNENSHQTVLGVHIYPTEYFSPLDMNNGHINLTQNTYSIHRYAGSWADEIDRYGYNLKWMCYEKHGAFFGRIEYIFRYTFYVLKKRGFRGLINKIKKKKRNSN